MSLQELSDNQRIIFLQEFVKSIILSLYQESQTKNAIESEKIKIKYLEKNKPFESFGNKIPFAELSEKISEKKYIKPVFPMKIPQKTMSMRKIYPFNRSSHLYQPQQKVLPSIKPIQQSPQLMQQQNIHQQTVSPTSQTTQIPFQLPSQQVSQQIQTNPTSNPLAKIESLVKDQGVQLIECPGAGKFILVKVRNKINTTKITLTEEEIKAIIDYFAQQADIPIVGGILRAAVDDMLISAVSSNYVGSRFIITKKSPYSLIEGVMG